MKLGPVYAYNRGMLRSTAHQTQVLMAQSSVWVRIFVMTPYVLDKTLNP